MKSAEYGHESLNHDELLERRTRYVDIVFYNAIKSQKGKKGSPLICFPQEKAKVINLSRRRRIKIIKHIPYLPAEIFSTIGKKLRKV